MELLERARLGDLEGVRTLIQGCVPVNTTNRCNQTALYCACERGHTEVARYLLDSGASVNLGAKPLLVAVKKNHYGCVELLLQHDVDVSCTNRKRRSPMSVAIRKRRYSIILLLLQYGAIPPASLNDIAVQLLRNAKVEHAKAIQKLLEQKNLNLTSKSTFLAAFAFAFKRGSVKLAGSMLSSKTYSDIEKLYPGATYFSAKNNWPTILSKLIGKGVDLNALTDGQTPLYVACEEGHESVVTLLLNNGAGPNVQNSRNTCIRNINKYPIHAACRGHHYDSVKLLLEYNADVTVRDKNGKTAMHLVLESKPCFSSETDKSSAIVQLLLDEGADVDAASEDGGTPFYVACSNGLAPVVAKMLQSGAKVDVNSGKKLPLIAACRNKHVSVVQLLLTNGANPDVPEVATSEWVYLYRCTLPLHIAAVDGNSELVELLLKHDANIDVTDVVGNTALHHTIENYHPVTTRSRHSDYVESVMKNQAVKSVLDILLKNKADVNIVNSSGETPLYKATTKTVELVDMLLKHGADPNVGSTNYDPDPKHKLPLFVAVHDSNIDITRSLLNAGASVNTMNHEGRNIVCFAAEKLTKYYYYSTKELRKQVSIMCLLLQQGGNFNMQLRDGRSPLYSALTSLARRRVRHSAIELLQLMVKQGAMLEDYSSPPVDDSCRQSLNSDNRGSDGDSGTLMALAAVDDKYEFIVDLLRAGAGFQLLVSCCSAVAGSYRKTKSIRLCQAAVLAGYTPDAGELHNLQLAADGDNAADSLLKQLVNWLNEDREQVPSLLRQCRVAIRRHLSAAVHYQTILPAIDKLPLPNVLKLYLQFDGKMTEVDFSVNQEMQTRDTTEETSAEIRHQLLSPYDFEYSDYDWSDFEDYDEWSDYDDYWCPHCLYCWSISDYLLDRWSAVADWHTGKPRNFPLGPCSFVDVCAKRSSERPCHRSEIVIYDDSNYYYDSDVGECGRRRRINEYISTGNLWRWL